MLPTRKFLYTHLQKVSSHTIRTNHISYHISYQPYFLFCRASKPLDDLSRVPSLDTNLCTIFRVVTSLEPPAHVHLKKSLFYTLLNNQGEIFPQHQLVNEINTGLTHKNKLLSFLLNYLQIYEKHTMLFIIERSSKVELGVEISIHYKCKDSSKRLLIFNISSPIWHFILKQNIT